MTVETRVSILGALWKPLHLPFWQPECGAGPLKPISVWLWGGGGPYFCRLLTSLALGGGSLQPPTGAREGQVEPVALIAVTRSRGGGGDFAARRAA